MLNVELHNHIAILTIDRPEVRGAMNEELALKIHQTLLKLDGDDEVKAIILTGHETGFCSGSDLKELATKDFAGISETERVKGQTTRSVSFLNKPVIAAVNKFAIGGGMVFAAMCDVVFTHKDSYWAFPEVALGWGPVWGVQVLLSRVGPVNCKRLAWGVSPCTGEEAYQVGLADFIVEEGTLLESTIEYAEKLAALPPQAVAATKQLLAPLVGFNSQALDNAANRAFVECCKTPEAKATWAKFGVTE